MSIAHLKLSAKRILQKYGTDVTLEWSQITGGTRDYTGALTGGSAARQTQSVRALIHTVSPATVAERQFVEVQTGDVLLDIDPATDLSGKPGARFIVEGKTYEQKSVGNELAECWDAVVGGQRILRTLLLRRAT